MIAILAGIAIPLVLTAWVLVPLKPSAASLQPSANCIGCGDPLEADARFCDNCGTPVPS